MTANKFRRLALDLLDVSEREHMGHPDFRVAGKIIATLGYPDESWGMVKLTPEQQRSFVTMAPDAFRPCNGTWGERGATNVQLASARVADVRAALTAAYRNVVAENKGLEESAQRMTIRRHRVNNSEIGGGHPPTTAGSIGTDLKP